MSQFYEWKELCPNVYHIGSGEQVFMDLFVGTERALLLDTGFGYGDLRSVISQITQLPLIVVNSHGHPDHVCGNFQFDGPVYIHPDDMALCQRYTSEANRRGLVETARNTVSYATGEVIDILPEGFNEEAYCHGKSGDLTPIREGEVFHLGGITLRVIEVPGHTVGSIGLLYEEENVFFAGDAMSPFVWLFSPESTVLSRYILTLKKAKALGFSSLVVAHHPVSLDAGAIDDYLDAAEHLNYETGVPFSHPLFSGIEARSCARMGYGPMDIGKPGFASVVINPDHID